MKTYRIYIGTEFLALEFGTSPNHALARYAQGSIFSITQLSAK